MRLLSLQLQNFRQHREAHIEFPEGVTAILGPNGSGKTTILEAISWALYGPVAIRGTKDTIRCRSSSGGAEVMAEVAFGFGGHTYTVVRTLDKAALRTDGMVSSEGISEVTETIKRLLNMDYQAFFNSFFTQQKQLSFMANMDGRQRATAITRMLGYERVTKARDTANADKLGYTREIQGLETGLGDLEEIRRAKQAVQARLEQANSAAKSAETAVEEKKRNVESLQPKMAESEAKFKKFEELSRALETSQQELRHIQERIAALESELSQLSDEEARLKKLQPVIAEFEKLQEEYNMLAELQKSEAKKQQLTGELKALEADERALIAKVAGAAKARMERDTDAKKLAEAEKKLNRLDEEIRKSREQRLANRQQAEAELRECKKRESEIAERRSAIKRAGIDGKCPTCERQLGEELPVVLANFDAQLNEVLQRIQELIKLSDKLRTEDETENARLSEERSVLANEVESLREIKNEKDAMVRQLETSQQELGDKQRLTTERREELEKLPTGFDQKRFDEVIQRGKELRKQRDLAKELEGTVRRRPNVEGELASRRQRAHDLERNILGVQESLREMAFDPVAYEQLRAEFEGARKLLSEAELELERRRSDVRAEMVVLDAAKRQKEAYESKKAQLDELRGKRLYSQTVAEALDSFRNFLNQRTRPDLESKAGQLLTDLTDGRYTTLEIDDNYQATVMDDGDRKPIISGGEDDVVNLSLRLAISEMIAERAGQPLSLLVLDEIFGSLDENRRDNVVSLLQNLKNRFQQIILITHVEAIHDMVDNCIWVEYDEREKISRVVEKNLELAEVTEF